MRQTLLRRGTMLLLCGWLATSPVSAADRPADKILADINAVAMPELTPEVRTDQRARQQYIIKRQSAMTKKAELIGELYKGYPDSPELVELLPERWQALSMVPGKGADETRAEVDAVLAKSKNEKLAAEAGFLKFVLAYQKAGRNADPGKLMPAFDEFAKRFPKDERGPKILMTLASMTEDEAKKEPINNRLLKDYPDSSAARTMLGVRRQREAVGKPFEIAFTDAVKGAEVSSKTLKGKVVVVDFWATWCGPCVAEMPTMKRLYAEYKDKGVEFIGVSLDQPKEEGGLDKLKEFVGKNGIEWPQFYQGKGWESEFSGSWGVQGIPCVFIVDADGNLASTDARGKLESLIPDLLEKAKKGQAKP